nr:hypothetical protein GCM10020063_009970 [Dactylosporangium thailandense]
MTPHGAASSRVSRLRTLPWCAGGGDRDPDDGFLVWPADTPSRHPLTVAAGGITRDRGPSRRAPGGASHRHSRPRCGGPTTTIFEEYTCMAIHLRLADGDELQTPIRRFAHPGTGHAITLVGTLHFGRDAYFAGLRERIDALCEAGAVVHIEASGRVDGDHVGATEQELAVLADMDRAAALGRRWAGELGWASQVDALGYPPHWHRHDLPGLEMLRRVGVPVMARFAARQRRAVDWPETDTTGLERHRARMAIGLRSATAYTDKTLRRLGRHPVFAVVVNGRTAHALQQALAAEQDVVLVWGATHLPGFAAGLAEHGFAEVGEPEWHTALQLPSFRASLWCLATARLRRRFRTRRASAVAASRDPR